MSGKPAFVYHGSPYRLDRIEPQQASGGSASDSMCAIYAGERFEDVIPFALPIRWYPDCPGGKRSFSCEGGKTRLIYGSLNPDGVGYVYRLRSDTFRKIDDWQWVSETPCDPVEVTEIRVRDWLHTVEFSQEAAEINEKLYRSAKREGMLP